MTQAARSAGAETDGVRRALRELAAGRPVVVVDDPERENECDLVFAGEAATPELLAFTVRHSSGLICAPLPPERAERLALPQMVPVNEDPKRTAFTVSVDAAAGVSTGISAADRATTIRALADPDATPATFTRPGHVFPLRANPGGVLARQGHTEAGVDLARMAGLEPAAAIAELVSDDGSMLRAADLPAFLHRHDLVAVTVADIATYRRRFERQVVRTATTRLPTRHGQFVAHGYYDGATGAECIALVHGTIGDGEDVLCRVHSECFTGEALGSARCDCGAQLEDALARIVAEGRGVLVYVRGHEGRGIGLMRKLEAYGLQDAGADTVDANVALGLAVDGRDYGGAAQVLADLGVGSVRLLTNNPAKARELAACGLTVRARVASVTSPTPENLGYLRAKRDRLGHDVSWLADLSEPEGAIAPGGSDT